MLLRHSRLGVVPAFSSIMRGGRARSVAGIVAASVALLALGGESFADASHPVQQVTHATSYAPPIAGEQNYCPLWLDATTLMFGQQSTNVVQGGSIQTTEAIRKIGIDGSSDQLYASTEQSPCAFDFSPASGASARLGNPGRGSLILIVSNPLGGGTGDNANGFAPTLGRFFSPNGLKLNKNGTVNDIPHSGTNIPVFVGIGAEGVWSPDGSRLASWLKMVNIDGTDAHWTYSPAVGVDYGSGGLAWSPDGAQIAAGGASGLIIEDAASRLDGDPTAGPEPFPGIQVAGNPPTQILATAVTDVVWSPDSTRLAVVEHRSADNSDHLVVLNRDGTGALPLVDLGTNQEMGHLAWSPDGAKIAFDSNLASPAPQGDQTATNDIYYVSLAASTAPTAPGIVTAAAGNGVASVSWSPPTSDGNSALLSYTVTASTGPSTTVPAGTTTATLSGLTNGTPVTFSVRAVNAIGPSAPASSVAVTPSAAAPPPESVVGVVEDDGGTVSTGSPPTPGQPLEVTVTSPVAGTITIATRSPSAGAPSGYGFLGDEVAISAPSASVSSPLQLEFDLDATLLGGVSPSAVQIFRNGAPIADCAPNDGTATPDPCIGQRNSPSGTDAQVIVLTSEASRWNFGFRQLDTVKPVVTFSSHATSYTVDQNVAITCSFTDPAPSSGIRTSTCPSASGPAFTFGLGTHSLNASVTDNAGNTGTAATTFAVTVTIGSLCKLTQQFVDGSPKYATLTQKQKATLDASVSAICTILNQLTPKLSAKQKQALIAAYGAAVDALVKQGWLTAPQVAMLKTFAAAL